MLIGFDPYKKLFILTGLAYGFRIPKKHPSMWPFIGNYKQRNFTQYERTEIAQTIIKWLQMGVVYAIACAFTTNLRNSKGAASATTWLSFDRSQLISRRDIG